MLLQRRRSGDDLHRGLVQHGGILGDSGEVREQRLKTMNGESVLGTFGMGFEESFGRTLRGSHDGIALGLSSSWIVIVKENRCQSTAHVPFDIVGQHAEENV